MVLFKRLRKTDPLILFLIAGMALYLTLDAAGLARGDERLIAVDEARLSAFMASQGGQSPNRTLDRLSAAQRRELVNDYVREQALYREAKALGLDREDSAIRRRLVQSLRFSLRDEDAADVKAREPTDAELRGYFRNHRDRYVASAKVSFSHVFFDKRRRGDKGAAEAAQRALPQAGMGDWLAKGDRYPYQRSEIDVTEDGLAAEMGAQAARRIFAMPQGDRWQGPVESDLGYHLIRIDRKTPGGAAAFEDVRGDLAAGLAREKRERDLQRAIDGIVEGYTVSISPQLQQTLQ